MNVEHPTGGRLRAYVQLMRPANVVTAWADVVAGFAASGLALGGDAPGALGLLLLATTGLYGGGVVMNDVFDAELDADERPERPIPSGRVSRAGAAGFGMGLLATGITAAAFVSAASGGLAAAIAVLALLYDRFGKHHPVLGPLNMGACRGGNLLLGVSAAPAMVGARLFLAAIPVLYVAAITAVSRGEVHGGRRSTGLLALGLIGLVLAGLAGLELLAEFSVLQAGAFALLFGWQVVPAFARAARTGAPEDVRRAVRAGVLSLILLDAALAAGFAGWPFGLVVLALWPLSVLLARAFAVT